MVLGFENQNENLRYAYSGFEALKTLEKAFDENDARRYSLILIECKMPIMDGYETIKRIQWLYDGIGLP